MPQVYEVLPNAPEPDYYKEDIENRFEEWRAQAQTAGEGSPGTIRVYKVPFDAEGKALHSASNQIRLGSYPIDQYNFDELCNKIIKEFMLPTEKQMAVRFIGSETGKPGIRFNTLVTLQRPNSTTIEEHVQEKSPLGEIIKAMQQSNAQMMKMLSGNSEGGNSHMNQMMQFAAMQRAMMEPFMGMVTAILGRPAPVAPPAESGVGALKSLLEGLALLDDMRGPRAAGGSSSDGVATIVRAVADVAGPVLKIAAERSGASVAVTPPARRISIAPPQPNPVPRPSVSTSVTPPPTGPSESGGVDLSKPSSVQANPFAPGPDLSQPSQVESAVDLSVAKTIIDSLVSSAEQGADPVIVADTFFENTMLTADDQLYGQLAELIDRKNFIGQIMLLNSNVGKHQIFFESLRCRLKERIEQEDQAADAEDSTG